MLLNSDIGNTNIKSALFEDERLIELIVHSEADRAINYLNELRSLRQRFVRLSAS